MKFKGRWLIYEMEMWDEDYFNEEVQAYMSLLIYQLLECIGKNRDNLLKLN